MTATILLSLAGFMGGWKHAKEYEGSNRLGSRANQGPGHASGRYRGWFGIECHTIRGRAVMALAHHGGRQAPRIWIGSISRGHAGHGAPEGPRLQGEEPPAQTSPQPAPATTDSRKKASDDDIRTAWAKTGGNILQTANLVGIARSALKKRLEKLGLKEDAPESKAKPSKMPATPFSGLIR